MNGIIIVALTIAFAPTRSVSDENCNASPDQRLECGWPGISSDQCKLRDCCFDDTIIGVKYCFMPDYQCGVLPAKRTNCGYVGITEADCIAKNCCYNTKEQDASWCFQRGSACSVSFMNRVLCSPNPTTISQADCQGLYSCCYDTTNQVCFKRRFDV